MKGFIRIIVYVLAPVLAVMTAAGYIFHSYGREAAHVSAEKKLTSAAKLTARLVDHRVRRIDQSLQTILIQEPLINYFMFRRADLLDEAEDNRLQLEATLERLVITDPRIVLIELYAMDGERFVAIVNGQRDLAQKNRKSHPWFQRIATKQSDIGFEKGVQLRISRVGIDERGNPIAAATVIYDSKKLFTNATSFAWQHLEDAQITIVDDHGDVFFRRGEISIDNGSLEQSAAFTLMPGAARVRQTRSAALSAFEHAEETLFFVFAFITLGLLAVAAVGTQLVVRNLREAQKKAEQANRAKSAFLANMSHEIRTPMNGVLGMLQLLSATQLNNQQTEYAQLATTSAESLLRILNDVLDFSKIEAGKLELDVQAFSLREVVGKSLQTFAMRAAAKQLELAPLIHADVPDHLVGDHGRLSQVIVNLVGNAVKFTEQGEIVVTIEQVKQTGERVALRFSVRDTGIGIPEEKHAEIFEAFRQADSSTTRRYGGTGLGLAIASHLVRMLGGELKLRSKPDEGSEFSFELPFKIMQGEWQPRVDAAAVRNVRVLVVDDNATNRAVFTNMLQHFGMSSEAVAGGPAALEALRAGCEDGRPFGLVLVDGMMPGMDGLETTKRLRGQPQFASIPVILLSSADQLLDSAKAEELQIGRCLIKPVRQSDLLNAVVELLSPTIRDRQSATVDGKGNTRPVRVLLAEDGLVNQKFVVRLLESRGHNVTVVSDGAQAVDAAARDRFDLILMDVEMPEMDGLEATTKIRESERQTGDHVPIVALTAHALKGHREDFLAAGMDDYMAKPIYADQLYTLVERYTPAAPCSEVSPEPQPEPSAETNAVVDWNSALKRVGGDRQLLNEIVETFLSESPQLLEQIANGLESRDADQVRRSAHTLKNNCDIFGATSIVTLAQRVEELATDGELTDAADPLSVLRLEIASLTAELKMADAV